jgi:ribosome-associated protein
MTDNRLHVTPWIALDPEELDINFVRARGPGGQNVNKVSSAVQLRFDAASSPNLTEAVRARLLSLAGRRATKDGVIVIAAQQHRTQERNRADAMERLLDLIRRAAIVPKRRIATKASRGSKERRLKSKKRRAGAKAARIVRFSDDD